MYVDIIEIAVLQLLYTRLNKSCLTLLGKIMLTTNCVFYFTLFFWCSSIIHYCQAAPNCPKKKIKIWRHSATVFCVQTW